MLINLKIILTDTISIPSNLRANSFENKILASLLWLYAFPGSYEISLFKSSSLILPLVCAKLDT